MEKLGIVIFLLACSLGHSSNLIKEQIIQKLPLSHSAAPSERWEYGLEDGKPLWRTTKIDTSQFEIDNPGKEVWLNDQAKLTELVEEKLREEEHLPVKDIALEQSPEKLAKWYLKKDKIDKKFTRVQREARWPDQLQWEWEARERQRLEEERQEEQRRKAEQEEAGSYGTIGNDDRGMNQWRAVRQKMGSYYSPSSPQKSQQDSSNQSWWVEQLNKERAARERQRIQEEEQEIRRLAMEAEREAMEEERRLMESQDEARRIEIDEKYSRGKRDVPKYDGEDRRQEWVRRHYNERGMREGLRQQKKDKLIQQYGTMRSPSLGVPYNFDAADLKNTGNRAILTFLNTDPKADDVIKI